MKTKTILLIAFVIFSLSLTAQRRECRKEQIKSQKVAFITEKLNLSVEEAQKFWPVYNEYQNINDKLHLEKRAIIRNYETNSNSLKENELLEMYNKLIELDKEQLEAEIKYQKQLLNVLPVSKIMELKTVDREFKHQLIHKLRHQ